MNSMKKTAEIDRTALKSATGTGRFVGRDVRLAYGEAHQAHLSGNANSNAPDTRLSCCFAAAMAQITGTAGDNRRYRFKNNGIGAPFYSYS